MKKLILSICLVLMSASSSFAEELKVKEVIGMEVIIVDRETGQEWRVMEGDSVGEGWKVFKITEQLVTLEKETNDGMRIMAELVVKNLKTFELPSQ